MDTNTIITYLACIIFIFIFGRIFIVPLKHIIKLVINSILGGVLIFVINTIGSVFQFHIGLNIGTAIFVGILGVPRYSIIDYFEIIYPIITVSATKLHRACMKGIILNYPIVTIHIAN